MPTPRLPGLPTLTGLMLAAILAASITIAGPFPVPYEVMKDFQPLIATGVAVVSASLVFLGGTLAYRASMAKLALDRDIHEREVRRRQRGVQLRARFDVYAMGQSAAETRKLTKHPMPYDLAVPKIKLLGRQGIEDAWNKLEEFPGKISRAFSALKVEIFNFDFTVTEFGDRSVVIVASNSGEAASVNDLIDHLDKIESWCDTIFKALETEIADK